MDHQFENEFEPTYNPRSRARQNSGSFRPQPAEGRITGGPAGARRAAGQLRPQPDGGQIRSQSAPVRSRSQSPADQTRPQSSADQIRSQSSASQTRPQSAPVRSRSQSAADQTRPQSASSQSRSQLAAAQSPSSDSGRVSRDFTPAYRPAQSAGNADRGSIPGRESSDSRRSIPGRDGSAARESILSRERSGGGSSSGSGSSLRSKVMLITALCFVQFLIVLGIMGVRFVKQKQSLLVPSEVNMAEMTNPNIDHSIVQRMEGYWTVALFGVDSRDSRLGKGNNADVIIICNINRSTGEIKLVSVFRDTYMSLDDNGSYNKINQAYARGGPEQAIKVLNKNMDLQIDDYATFNWKAVADAINILGGVDVELSKAEFYYINAYITETVEATGVASRHLKQAGMNHLDGVQAVAYARLRKMDTDYARTERQRLIIQLCFDKLKQSSFSVINNVMEVVFPQVMTSVDFDDLIPLAKNIMNYSIGETMGFPQARAEVNMGNKGDCVIPATLESNVIALHQFLFDEADYQPSEQVKKISSKISADSGAYQEGKVIESVGTDGGYIPKPTQPKTTEETEETEETGETSESESSTGETDESIIDGEYDWGLELETDEDGNYIDPPEDFEPGSGQYPGGTRPSSGIRPGESTSESGRYPGDLSLSESGSGSITDPEESSSGSAIYPGGPTGETNDSTTGPGMESSGSSRPGSSSDDDEEGIGGSLAPYPGADTESQSQSGPGSIIIGPGGA